MIATEVTEGQHEGYTVFGSPKSARNFAVVLKGKNNVIELTGHPTIDHLKVEFIGDNNVLRIGANSRIKGVMTIGEGSRLTFGASVSITRVGHFVAREGAHITVGDRCLISNFTVMSSDAHSIFDRSTGERLNRARDVVIGDTVWLAANVAIYKGARIGSGSVIGAHSIVRGTIPANVVAAGSPAQVLSENIFWDRRQLPDGAHLLPGLGKRAP